MSLGTPPAAAQIHGESLESWTAILKALPIPAALVDAAGFVIAQNRWIDAQPGDPLITPADEAVAPGLAFGVDSTSRWRVRPLDDEATVLLATGEREDAGDHLLRKFFSSGDALFVVYDQAGRIIESNAAWENLLGYNHDEIFGLDSWTLLPPDDDQTRDTVELQLRQFGRCEPVFEMRASDGSYRLVQWALHFDTTVGRCFGIGRDITESDKQTAELERRAYTDELTGLANRAKFLQELKSWFTLSNTPAVLFCDLDHFKVINDSLGHRTGDQLLSQLATRLSMLTASEDSLVARLGGDEFVILLGNADRVRAVATAQEVMAAMVQPFEISGRPVHATMSIGITVADESGVLSADALLSEADTAAYKAKNLGRNRFVMFDEELRAAVDRRFNVEEGLHYAIENDKLEVHYQPIVNLAGGGIVGVEALIRWRTEDDQLIGPGGFLDVAEEAGLMPQIGRFVMKRAAKLGAEFAAAGRELTVSVNVDGQDLADPGFVERTLSTLTATGMSPYNLLLEITESAVHNTEASLPLLRDLRAEGIRIGLDDFGTGFSSLAHLRELPIDVVKVDRSFVADLIDDNVTKAVTASLVSLCGALGLKVVLEGIETTEHASAVEKIGGTMAQGYLFYRPMPEEDLKKLLGLKRTPISSMPREPVAATRRI